MLSKGSAAGAVSQKMEAATTQRETARGLGKSLSFPYSCVLLRLACSLLWMRQVVTITNEVNEMLPFIAFLELAVTYCGVFVSYCHHLSFCKLTVGSQ